MMKTKSILLTLLLTGSVASNSFAKPVAEALEHGIYLQETEGDINAAIAAYEEIIAVSEKQSGATIEAHFRLAKCYLDTGDYQKSEAALRAITEKYPASNPWVKRAAALLGPKIEFLPAPFSAKGEYYGYDIKLPNGKTMGYMFGGIHQTTHNGELVWESFFGRNADSESFSKCRFKLDDFTPIYGRSYFSNVGDFLMDYSKDLKIEITDQSTQKDPTVLDAPDGFEESGQAIYDNDQTIHLMRALDYEIGKDINLLLLSPFAQAPFPFIISPKEEVSVTTEAGAFECIKLETNINQTFYVSLDANRYIVKIEVGSVSIELATVEEWNPTTPAEIAATQLPVRFKMPDGSIYYPTDDSAKVFRLRYLCPNFFTLRNDLNVKPTNQATFDPSKTHRERVNGYLEKNREKFSKFEIIEDSWEPIRAAGMDGIMVMTTQTRGKITNSTYQAYLIDQDYSVAMQSVLHARDASKVREQMLVSLSNLSIND